MNRYKITGILYIHISMNEWVKFCIWEFPHKTVRDCERLRERERERENTNSIFNMSWLREGSGAYWKIENKVFVYGVYIYHCILKSSVQNVCPDVCMFSFLSDCVVSCRRRRWWCEMWRRRRGTLMKYCRSRVRLSL